MSPVSLCRCFVSLCRCVPVSLCRCVAVPLCRCVAQVAMCRCVAESLRRCVVIGHHFPPLPGPHGYMTHFGLWDVDARGCAPWWGLRAASVRSLRLSAPPQPERGGPHLMNLSPRARIPGRFLSKLTDCSDRRRVSQGFPAQLKCARRNKQTQTQLNST